MDQEMIMKEAANAIVNCDKNGAVDVAQRALSLGLDPIEVLNNGFSAGIKKVGDLFSRGEKFLPELILSADVMKAATEILNGAIHEQTALRKGKMLIATVAGDVHDIGKGIVISVIKTRGLEVIDLGRDVPVSTIMEKAVRLEADIIGTSALLTTTIMEQKKLEDELRKNGLRDRFKTMVGGAPATQRWADRIGADAYGEDAADAAVKAVALLAR
ncbi:methyltransferase cognate corrinoid protein [Candidatus Formimonas warabiya]|uniref:Dimethylamine corrinoid protein 3 n=1 Tax=Formimonas warabiya TaxID=1761012 RepID=A0A3G1KZ10_FORW1|nr:methyltransferase cognate corrinoid protein [Candidatus Formimonas warabiya]ATW27746.1 dimethylamine corrinoid protein 3 [Candidatus Formimonas warabiya]